MKQVTLAIGQVPAILWGEQSDKLYLYIHGQGGNKEEAHMFAEIAIAKQYQVLSFDLPEHGQRDDHHKLEPKDVICELHTIMDYARQAWNHISLCATSIGAWFAMMSYTQEDIKQCLFVSPIVNMHYLITQMMQWANVDVKRLENEKQIPTDFGQTLSWNYYVFVCDHPIEYWHLPTHILYAANDTMTSLSIIRDFQDRFACKVTIMENGEHWFHTPEQLNYLAAWFQKNVE